MTNNWQPIETAPKDGTRVDLYLIDGQRIINAWYDINREYWAHMDYDMFDSLDECRVRYTPTHWMPLPEPPQKDVSDIDVVVMGNSD